MIMYVVYSYKRILERLGFNSLQIRGVEREICLFADIQISPNFVNEVCFIIFRNRLEHEQCRFRLMDFLHRYVAKFLQQHPNRLNQLNGGVRLVAI